MSGIDALLEQGSTITGTLTKSSGGATVPAEGVSVYASSTDWWSTGFALTDADGRYTVDGLPAGNYNLEFDAGDPGIVSKWHSNAMTSASATVIAVAPKAAVVGINANLEEASTITGTVTQNIAGTVTNADSISVDVFTPAGAYVRSTATDVDGNYSVGSLMAGSYKVGFGQDGTSSGLVPEFFDNVSALSAATPVTVGAAATTTSINAELSDTPIATPAQVERLSGPDRFSTSAAISAASFDPGVPVAYIASGANFPDALSAAPVAGKNGGPVLLVTAEGIPTPVEEELKRLKPARIVVLGGLNAISSSVEKALKDPKFGAAVTRTAGPDRFATSAAISQAAFTSGVSVAYVANGYNFPDALSAAPVAGKNGAPVLLMTTDGIPATIQDELTRLKPDRIVVLGGVHAISDTAQTLLKKFTAGTVTRLSGADRFATSAAISEANFAAGAPVVYVANAHNFPDALSGAPVAGLKSAPVLLVPTDGIPAVIQA
ncbi:MAG TPA: cell wall-binding repeat-containing protein, partial [Cryobacterium sp.]|nr:cell wall-binding repeat-containing protein [Cryobacterium sp.]